MLGNWILDLRHAVRALRRAPGFTVAAGLTLALGIGATTGIFRVVNTILLRSLPYHEPERLVRLYDVYAPADVRAGNVSPVDVVDWRAQARSVSGIALLNSSNMAFTGAGEPDVIRAGVASANFFDLLGVQPVLGRTFRPAEEVLGNHRVAVLSHETWRSRWGADPSVVGRTITLAGFGYEVIGVLPPGFADPRGGRSPELWRPLALTLTPEARGGHWLQAVGRLSPGVALSAAQTELVGIAARLAAEYPATNTDRSVRLVQLHDAVSAEVRRPLIILLAAVGLLLAVACVNVANLVLVRAGGRARELAVRTALGAGRRALVRQLLVEHALLAAVGGALGLGLAAAMGRGLTALAGDLLPQLEQARTDGAVIAFSIGLTALTVLAFGMAPALRAARVDVRSSMMESGRGASAGRRAQRARVVLAGVQLALSFVLLAGAGLLVKSFSRLSAVDAGFAREGVLTFALALSGTRYPDDHTVQGFHRAFLERIHALPATRAAGFVDRLPLTDSYSCDSFGLGDRPAPPEGQEPCAEVRVATPGYFAAMGIPVLTGRPLTDTDRADALPVVVINATMARRYWPEGDPLGKPFAWGMAGPDARWRTIVGTVGDVRHFGLDQGIRPEVYMPAEQSAADFVVYVIRTAGDPRALVPTVRALVREMDPDLPVRDLRTMDDRVGASVAAPRLRTVLLGVFALLAAALAAVGVYGVLAVGVAQRTGEIGVRVALGARQGQIVSMVLRQGLAVAGVAIVAGLVAALWVMPVLTELLFEVSPADPAVLSGVGLFLLLTAALAGYLPARRAARIDPVEALRNE